MAAVVPLNEEKTKAVLRQVEFYFSDSNLPRDNFLKKTVEESEDGLVSLKLICSFSRMRGHLDLGAAKQEEVPDETVLAVSEVLKRSSFLKVSEDGKRIGRSSELLKPEVVIEQVDSRTVAAGPLPCDVKVQDLENFFGQHGKVNSVRLPRHVGDKRQFCGTALVEFSDEEDATKVLNGSFVYAGADLEISPKKDFDAEREKKWKEFGQTNSNSNDSNGRSDGNSYPKGLILAFKLKSMSTERSIEENGPKAVTVSMGKHEATENANEDEKSSENVGQEIEEKADENPKQENEQKATGNEDEKSSENVEKEREEKAEENPEQENEQKATDNEDEKSSEIVEKERDEKADENPEQENEQKSMDNACQESKDNLSKGSSMVSEENNGSSDDNIISREDLKNIFQKFGTVKFVDYTRGGESGYIRYEDPDAAVKARAIAVLADNGGLVVKNSVAVLEALTGDAEREYWSTVRGIQEKRRENFSTRGRHGRGGRHFSGKRGRQMDSSGADGRSNKSHKASK